MKKTIRILAILGIFQIILIALTWTGGTTLHSHPPGSLLFSFEKNAIDKIVIRDADNEMYLSRENGQWLLPDNFPANPEKVSALLSKLATLQYGIPVATSSQALNRFHVASDHFERHLLLQSKGKTLAELYLGTGAGARQSHARSKEQNAVYNLALGTYDLPVTADSWQDRDLLQFKIADVHEIRLHGLQFQKNTEKKKNDSPVWQTVSPPPDRDIDLQAFSNGVKNLATLRFDKLLGREEQQEYGLAKPLLELKLLFSDTERVYRFGRIKDSKNVCLKVSDREEYFQLNDYQAKALLELFDKAVSVKKEHETETEK